MTRPADGSGAAARRLAGAAWLLPVVLFVALFLHSHFASRGGASARQRAWAATLQLDGWTLTPTGRPPRTGPGSHPAVDVRHSPFVPSISPLGRERADEIDR